MITIYGIEQGCRLKSSIHPDNNRYILHAGSFKVENNARTYRNKIKKTLKNPLLLSISKAPHGNFYVVSAGPFTGANELQKVSCQLLHNYNKSLASDFIKPARKHDKTTLKPRAFKSGNKTKSAASGDHINAYPLKSVSVNNEFNQSKRHLSQIPSIFKQNTVRFHSKTEPKIFVPESVAPTISHPQMKAVVIKESNTNKDLFWPEARALGSKKLTQALAMHPGNNKDDIIRRMTLLLWIAENDKSKKKWAIAEGEMLYIKNPFITELQPLQARLTRNTQWFPFTNISSSAGLRYIEEKGWFPDVPMMRVRKALMGPGSEDEQVLYGSGDLVFVVNNNNPSTLHFKLKVDDARYLVQIPLTAEYQIDEEQVRRLHFSAGQTTQTLTLQISKGKHLIKFRNIQPVSNQILRIRLTDTQSSPELKEIEKSYIVATPDTPIKFQIAGPVLLRIDELRDGVTLTRYHLVTSRLESVELKTEGHRKEALFRISQRILAEEGNPIRPRQLIKPLSLVPAPYFTLQQPTMPSPVTLYDGLALGGQEDGTWSISISENRRRNVLQKVNNISDFGIEVYKAANINYRHYNENWHTYLETGVVEHVRRYGGAAFGLEGLLTYEPVWSSLKFSLAGNAYFQNPNGKKWIPFTGNPGSFYNPVYPYKGKQEWSTTWIGAIYQKRDLTPKSYHIPTLTGLVRELSLENNLLPGNGTQIRRKYDPRNIDQDIYIQYASNHRQIVEIADAYFHRPWLDSLWYVGGAASSSPDLTLLSSNFNMGWRQLIGPFQANTNFQYARYYPEQLLRRSYNLNVLWNKWQNSKQLFEISCNIRRDIDVHTTTGFLIFTWYFSEGRGYRDFQIKELNFLDLRTRNIPSQPNNIIGLFK